MNNKIVSSLTDEELRQIGFTSTVHQTSDREKIESIKRNVANAAAQRAIEEFQVIAKKREAELIEAAFKEASNQLSANTRNYFSPDVEKLIRDAAREQLKRH
jgi:negative regulator of replication initiation